MLERMKLTVALASIAGLALADEAVVRIELGRAERTMAGGIGASWHAIRANIPGPRASAWGANPPLDNAKAWQQIQHHAQWLGLDWLRVQIDQRMYEPERGRFDWNNDEMRTLYRILDWAQAHDADVFLQQMWSHVAWNAVPNVAPLRSAPRSMRAFAEGLATLAEHLLKARRYTCIKWLNITNEPGNEWSWWQGPGGPESITPGLAEVKAEFDRRGIKLPLSGPGWLEPRPPERLRIDFDPHVAAYDIHWFSGLDAQRQGIVAAWAAWAHGRRKPLFLSEFGDVRFGTGPNNPGPATFKAALSNAETVVRGLAAGVDAFSRCSFLNRGDLDGQWQLVRTWDPKTEKHLAEPAIEPAAYYGHAILTRFAAKHSHVLKCTVAAPRQEAAPGIVAAALRSPKGRLTIFLVNPTDAEHEVTVVLAGLAAPTKLSRYQLTAAVLAARPTLVSSGQFALSAQTTSLADTLPPRSITTLTTYSLGPDDPGVMAD